MSWAYITRSKVCTTKQECIHARRKTTMIKKVLWIIQKKNKILGQVPLNTQSVTMLPTASTATNTRNHRLGVAVFEHFLCFYVENTMKISFHFFQILFTICGFCLYTCSTIWLLFFFFFCFRLSQCMHGCWKMGEIDISYTTIKIEKVFLISKYILPAFFTLEFDIVRKVNKGNVLSWKKWYIHTSSSSSSNNNNSRTDRVQKIRLVICCTPFSFFFIYYKLK